MFGNTYGSGMGGMPFTGRDLTAGLVGAVLGAAATALFMTKTDKGAEIAVKSASDRIIKQRKAEGKSTLANALAASNAKLELGGFSINLGGGPSSDSSDLATREDAMRSAPRAYSRVMRSKLGNAVVAMTRRRNAV